MKQAKCRAGHRTDHRPFTLFAAGIILFALAGCQAMIDTNNPRAKRSPPVTNWTQSSQPADMAGQPAYYQLILTNAPPGIPDGPALKHVHVQHVAARSVGELLSSLYLPAGPSGTPERYALIYASATEWNAAAEAASTFDVPAARIDANSEAATFVQAISAYYAAVSNQSDTETWRAILDQLERGGQKENEAARQKWAANMLAGAIAADRLYNSATAEQMYRSAEICARPGSLEQLNAMYRRARIQLQSGAGTTGRRLLTQIVGQFPAFRSSEAFERARQQLAEKGRG